MAATDNAQALWAVATKQLPFSVICFSDARDFWGLDLQIPSLQSFVAHLLKPGPAEWPALAFFVLPPPPTKMFAPKCKAKSLCRRVGYEASILLNCPSFDREVMLEAAKVRPIRGGLRYILYKQGKKLMYHCSVFAGSIGIVVQRFLKAQWDWLVIGRNNYLDSLVRISKKKSNSRISIFSLWKWLRSILICIK